LLWHLRGLGSIVGAGAEAQERAIWERSVKGDPWIAGGSGFREKTYEKVRINLTGRKIAA
jgi:hypothetical protein